MQIVDNRISEKKVLQKGDIIAVDNAYEGADYYLIIKDNKYANYRAVCLETGGTANTTSSLSEMYDDYKNKSGFSIIKAKDVTLTFN